MRESNSEKWILEIDNPRSGAENMSRDAKRLAEAAAGKIPPLLRFFDWSAPTVTIGYGQPRGQIDRERCAADGVEVAVRPTGGRAVLHWDEITYSIVFPAGHPITAESVLESYRRISGALISGLEELGVFAELTRGEPGAGRTPSCFSSASRYEVAVAGKKLVGSAQRRKGGALLQQGSLPLGPEYSRLGRYLTGSRDIEEAALKSTSLGEVMGILPHRREIIAALVRGFEKEFNTGENLWPSGSPCGDERNR